MGRPFVATMIGGAIGGLRSLAAVAGRKLTPFHGADGADALQRSASNGLPAVATMFGGGLDGCGPSQPPVADINTASRRRRSGRPPADRPAMAFQPWQRCSVEAWRDAVPRSRR
jgi:hypothetical protein